LAGVVASGLDLLRQWIDQQHNPFHQKDHNVPGKAIATDLRGPRKTAIKRRSPATRTLDHRSKTGPANEHQRFTGSQTVSSHERSQKQNPSEGVTITPGILNKALEHRLVSRDAKGLLVLPFLESDFHFM